MKKRIDFVSNLTHKIFYIITTLIIISAIAVNISALTTGSIPSINPGHNSTQIFIQSSSNCYVSLQNALNNGYLVSSSPVISSCDSLPVLSPYHLASQILVTVGSNTMTLQDAFDNKVFSGQTFTSSKTLPSGGQYASSIKINTVNGLTDLQSAIGSSLLSPCTSGMHWDSSQNKCITDYTYSWYSGLWSGCSASCGGSKSRTVYCQRNDGVQVADSFCTGTKPQTDAGCSCHWTDHGRSSCDFFIFYDTCNPSLSCSTAGSQWHCLFKYPGAACGFLGMTMDVLDCENS